jgi:hypothetical protein
MRLGRVNLPRMRLIHTSVAAVAILAVSGTAFAASTKDEVDRTMGGTSRVEAGGKLEMVVQRRSATARDYRVTIHYEATVRSKTVIGFKVYPCKSTTCKPVSSDDSNLSRAGHWRMTFTGRVPARTRDDGTACVYAQVRDRGAGGKVAGKIVRTRNGRKGITFCREVE